MEVLDLDTRPPSLLGLDSESTSGRGLHIIAGIAKGWGWQTAEGPDAQAGKVVWAELADSEAVATPDELDDVAEKVHHLLRRGGHVLWSRRGSR